MCCKQSLPVRKRQRKKQELHHVHQMQAAQRGKKEPPKLSKRGHFFSPFHGSDSTHQALEQLMEHWEHIVGQHIRSAEQMNHKDAANQIKTIWWIQITPLYYTHTSMKELPTLFSNIITLRHEGCIVGGNWTRQYRKVNKRQLLFFQHPRTCSGEQLFQVLLHYWWLKLGVQVVLAAHGSNPGTSCPHHSSMHGMWVSLPSTHNQTRAKYCIMVLSIRKAFLYIQL